MHNSISDSEGLMAGGGPLIVIKDWKSYTLTWLKVYGAGVFDGTSINDMIPFELYDDCPAMCDQRMYSVLVSPAIYD